MDSTRAPAGEVIRQLRERLTLELRAGEVELEKIEVAVRDLRARHRKLEESLRSELEALERTLVLQPSAASPSPVSSAQPSTGEAPSPGPVAPVKVVTAAPAGARGSNGAEEKVLKDAQRFARLLISEIELYNRPLVAEARREGNLYARLRPAIDRSRQAYEKRFGDTPAKDHRYFHDELVRTLAGNDPNLLGADYPGPSA